MSGAVAPVGPGDAFRARVPDVLATFRATRANVLDDGRIERALKCLCARYLNGDPDLEDFESSTALDERERAALGWAHAVAWDPTLADDPLWNRLHEHFSEPELVELGYCIAVVHGQLRWLRTLGVRATGDGALGV